jgi:hypothetical protein
VIYRFTEVTNLVNWGKFLVSKFDENDHAQVSAIDHGPLIQRRGWTRQHLFVMDLQTGEGAMFLPGPGGSAMHDLERHRIWCCPMYQYFLERLYVTPAWWDVVSLPAIIKLGPEVPSALAGYRRKGPSAKVEARVEIETELPPPPKPSQVKPRRRGHKPKCAVCYDQKVVRLVEGASPSPCQACRPNGSRRVTP